MTQLPALQFNPFSKSDLRKLTTKPLHNMTTPDSTPTGDLTTRVLHALSQKEPILSTEAFPESAFTDLKAALDRLASRSMVVYEPIDREEAVLEPEGLQIAEQGSHEARVFEALRQAVEGLSVTDLEKTIGDKTVTKVGQGKAFKEKWITKNKDGKLVANVRTRGCPGTEWGT